MEIPCLYLFGNTFQLGYGMKSRLFDSSNNDQTSVIASSLVKNKIVTGNFLRSFKLPVVESRIINNVDEAVNF